MREAFLLLFNMDSAAPKSGQRRWRASANTLLWLSAGLSAICGAWKAILAIPNGPETLSTHVPILEKCLLGDLAVMAVVIVALFKTSFQSARRAARFTAGAAVASAVLWYAPVPFAPQRYVCAALLLAGAAFFALALVRLATWRSVDSLSVAAPWLQAKCAAGLAAAAIAAILLLKINAIGWEAAID